MLKAIVTRPTNGSGNKTVTLTASIKRGTVTETKTFLVSVREEGLSDNQCVTMDKAALDIAGKDAIKANITLPTTTVNGTTITWATDKPDVISTLGAVTRPANGQPEVTVTLTATIKKGTVTDTKIITVKVVPWTDDEEIQIAYDALTWEVIRGTNINTQGIVSSLSLATSGEKGTTISWSSTSPTVVAADGTVTRPNYVDGDVVFSLTATISKGTGSDMIKQFLNYKVTKLAQTNAEAVDAALASITDATIKGTNSALTAVTTNLVLPKIVDSSIDAATVSMTWSQVKSGTSTPSSYLTITDNGGSFTGVVTQPASTATNEQIVLTLTAVSTTASGATSTKTKTFNIIIPKS